MINWLALAGFELLVLLFTRLSPKWLTIPSAIILIVPLFASSIVFPLTDIFIPGSRKESPIGNNFFYDVRPWSNSGGGNAGVDVLIYYHPPLRSLSSSQNANHSFQQSGVQLKRRLCRGGSQAQNRPRPLSSLALAIPGNPR